MDNLRVWVNDRPVGRLARHGNGSTFVYDSGVSPSDAVSLVMPVRVASYDKHYGMLPIFDTNLPEGALRERIMKALAKASQGRIDEVDVLGLTGGNQIGRIRILPDGQQPVRRDPIGKIDDILERETSKTLISEIMERYALRSGVSGAMPKVLVDDMLEEEDHRRSTIQTRDYILKFDDTDFPGLSLNEFHCLETARAAGLRVAGAKLSRDGRMLAVRRFDEQDDRRLGFEDFASLNGLTSAEKYSGTIEKGLFRMLDSISGQEARANLEDLYRMLVLNIGLRNGDAHMKNFAVLFDDALKGPIRLAPAYDIVTTQAWIGEDRMALTYGGTKRWPNAKALHQMGARARLTPARATEIIAEVGEAIRTRMPVMIADLTGRGLADLAARIAGAWNAGLSQSLGLEPVDLAPLLALPGTEILPEPETGPDAGPVLAEEDIPSP